MLTLFHDYTSPASAVAVLRVHQLLDEGLDIGFAGFESIGVDAPIPVTLDVLAQLDQHRDEAAALGLQLQRPDRLPPTVRAHLAEDYAAEHGRDRTWREAAYRAFWERGADLADVDVLCDIAAEVGLVPARLAVALIDRTAAVTFRREVHAARSAGVGGVPTIEANGTLLPGLTPLVDLRMLAKL